MVHTDLLMVFQFFLYWQGNFGFNTVYACLMAALVGKDDTALFLDITYGTEWIWDSYKLTTSRFVLLHVLFKFWVYWFNLILLRLSSLLVYAVSYWSRQVILLVGVKLDWVIHISICLIKAHLINLIWVLSNILIYFGQVLNLILIILIIVLWVLTEHVTVFVIPNIVIFFFKFSFQHFWIEKICFVF